MITIGDVLQPVPRRRSKLSFVRHRRATAIDLRPWAAMRERRRKRKLMGVLPR